MPLTESRFAAIGLLVFGALACGGSYQNGGPGGASGGNSGSSANAGSSASAGASLGGTGAASGDFSGAGTGAVYGEPGCVSNGSFYGWGQSFPASDGCNTCTCSMDGSVDCTLIACVSCSYAGTQYRVGDVFADRDGCNQCSCLPDGSVSCSNAACACNRAQEWWRQYSAMSPAACASSRYTCPTNTTSFSNDCGCGCEEPTTCAQYLNCIPGAGSGCDMAQAKVDCPFILFAI